MNNENQNRFTPYIQFVDQVPVCVSHKNNRDEVESLEHLLTTPTRIRIKETLRTFNSFVETLKDRVCPENATVYTGFCTKGKYEDFAFRAVAQDCRQDIEWRDDIQFMWVGRYTKDFEDWINTDEVGLPQEKFALFLDKKIHNIVSGEEVGLRGMPTQMDLYNFVTTFEDGHAKKFARKVNVQNGISSVCLEQTLDDGTTHRLKMFERFAIRLQVYEGFPEIVLTVKLRFRIQDGSVVFYYDIEGLEAAFISMRDWAASQITSKTNIKVCL